MCSSCLLQTNLVWICLINLNLKVSKILISVFLSDTLWFCFVLILLFCVVKMSSVAQLLVDHHSYPIMVYNWTDILMFVVSVTSLWSLCFSVFFKGFSVRVNFSEFLNETFYCFHSVVHLVFCCLYSTPHLSLCPVSLSPMNWSKASVVNCDLNPWTG